ncbi:hypothetical protein JKP88DRAFT_351322 [Tribonema minus]|uniref:Uncharacterized protein ycf23 n=1 Tax=Tribonema minus TaxID=303371 RepID=A0A835YK10_9STRA|nr:hypothetical protein JKP88DRAFT_351322 [Tribonema minus]
MALKVTAAAVVASLCGVEGFMTMSGDAIAPFRAHKALKIISGITNFDSELVRKVAVAAQAGGATHLDIAADPELVKLAKRTAPSVSICVSAIEPELLVPCVEAGADMVELGNFDMFYDQGMDFTADDVITMTKATRALLPKTPLSVTIPHKLHMDQQVTLAQALQELGVDVIQTEGKYSLDPSAGGLQGVIERAAPALAATYAIARAVDIPVMTSSGISEVTASMALAAGASGVGVGSAVNKLNAQVAMIAVVRALAIAMDLPAPATMPVEQKASTMA